MIANPTDTTLPTTTRGGRLTQPAFVHDLVVNRRARYEYFLLDSFEAGLALVGSEVKSLRAGRGNLQEAFIAIRNGSAFLHGCHISPYAEANRNNHEPLRVRQLLLNRSEIEKITKAVQQKGMTAVPVRIYIKGRRIKVEIALAKGKKLHDKRETLKKRDAEREMDRSR
jgi:SsrA-binding protein